MKTIGLIDVDAVNNHGAKFPNLALMRISAWHKAQGDLVEWWWSDLVHYDIVYMSKVFSDDYSPDIPAPMNADKVIKGGTGYAIRLENGKEVFDKTKHTTLPEEVEKMFPDYSIYPQFNFAVSLTSRGCPRGCAFCIVASKEGRCSRKVANVKDFWNGQPHIEVLDPNITACREKRDLFKQYRETGATITFNQGLDIRCMNDDDINDINHMRIKYLHMAWDNPEDDLRDKFSEFAAKYRWAHKGLVYCLTNFENVSEQEHIDRALHRIYFLRDHGFDPYVMVYNKPTASQQIRDMQRWCNNKVIFRKAKRFEDYVPARKECDDSPIEGQIMIDDILEELN